ncbi:hypothetical protein BC834DRAFT_414494 [Gloeopeniophorella convolvens]|nr:hypothetical protein BC834DRAFT_414494 [Gloeopeniophorella convolvens]
MNETAFGDAIEGVGIASDPDVDCGWASAPRDSRASRQRFSVFFPPSLAVSTSCSSHCSICPCVGPDSATEGLGAPEHILHPHAFLRLTYALHLPFSFYLPLLPPTSHIRWICTTTKGGRSSVDLGSLSLGRRASKVSYHSRSRIQLLVHFYHIFPVSEPLTSRPCSPSNFLSLLLRPARACYRSPISKPLTARFERLIPHPLRSSPSPRRC